MKRIVLGVVFVVFILGLFWVLFRTKKLVVKDDGLAVTSQVLQSLDQQTDLNNIIEIQSYKEKMKAALNTVSGVLQFDKNISTEQSLAQEITLNNQKVLTETRDKATGKALWSEVFGIYPLRDSDINERTKTCVIGKCFKVEIYNYALDNSITVFVDVSQKTVLDLVVQKNFQPDIPAHLQTIAVKLAVNNPAVQKELGLKPEDKEAMMANTKTSLKNSKCERSNHLCVAPTFMKDDRALWAIVDLTDYKVVGVKWTKVGRLTNEEDKPVTEKEVQNDQVMQHYCEKNTAAKGAGWEFNYMLTSSDGLRISEVKFNNQLIFDSVKQVDWHVSYSKDEGFGYSDAVGCPVFSQAAVLAYEPPELSDIKDASGQVIGLRLTQEFESEEWPRPCNYHYQQHYDFYKNGNFQPIVESLGRGCGDDGTYRPVTRVAFAKATSIEVNKNNIWQKLNSEQYFNQNDLTNDSIGAQIKIYNNDFMYQVVPGNVKYGNGTKNDQAYMYFTKHKLETDEGDSDMITIGPCCNIDYRQGPEKFINAEDIDNQQTVFWYVPQLKNNDKPGQEYCWADSVLENGKYVEKVYPCASGPLFINNKQ